MADTPIIVEDLSKLYRIGISERRPDTLVGAVVSAAAAPLRNLRRLRRLGTTDEAGSDSIWALRDVSFEVERGEVLGIVGRNGAGKSTLLKILSRITEPTRGRVRIRGRVSSLLEVGTGFHPELTGRENVYLNGTILGMTKREVDSKFDDIVDFSGVEKYLDTPVKRYSSGMRVRLAFAVAANLDPEILIVDEVLAVGDAAFQRKCIRRMGEVSRSGRTVLLVSHNLASVTSLCSRAILLDAGRLVDRGEANYVVSRYLSWMRDQPDQTLENRLDREGTGRARVVSLQFEDGDGAPVQHIFCGNPASIVIGYRAEAELDEPCVALSLWSTNGHKIFHVDNLMRDQGLRPFGESGEYRCHFPRLNLAPGLYYVNVMLKSGGELLDHVHSASELEILPSDFYGIGKISRGYGGMILADHHWH